MYVACKDFENEAKRAKNNDLFTVSIPCLTNGVESIVESVKMQALLAAFYCGWLADKAAAITKGL